MDRSASRNGFCHQQSRAVTVQPRAVTVRGINWVLIEEPTFQPEAAYLGPGRKFGGKEIAPLPTGFSDFILNESSPPNCTCAMLAIIGRGCGETD